MGRRGGGEVDAPVVCVLNLKAQGSLPLWFPASVLLRSNGTLASVTYYLAAEAAVVSSSRRLRHSRAAVLAETVKSSPIDA